MGAFVGQVVARFIGLAIASLITGGHHKNDVVAVDPPPAYVVQSNADCSEYLRLVRDGYIKPSGSDPIECFTLWVKSQTYQGQATQPSLPVITCTSAQQIPKGAKVTVGGGCVISGDISVNGKDLFDDDSTTCLVVIVNAPVGIYAPYGATATNSRPQDVIDAVKQPRDGVPNGCSVVAITVP